MRSETITSWDQDQDQGQLLWDRDQKSGLHHAGLETLTPLTTA